MRTYLVIKRMFMTGLLVLIPWSAALITQAADHLEDSGTRRSVESRHS